MLPVTAGSDVAFEVCIGGGVAWLREAEAAGGCGGAAPNVRRVKVAVAFAVLGRHTVGCIIEGLVPRTGLGESAVEYLTTDPSQQYSQPGEPAGAAGAFFSLFHSVILMPLFATSHVRTRTPHNTS